MSSYEFARVWGESTATGSALLTHLALADCAVNGIAQARHEALAIATRLSVASIARAIQHLVDIDEILIVEPKAGSRPAQIAVLPWSGGSVPILKHKAIKHALSFEIESFEPVEDADPGPTEIIPAEAIAITGEPDEPDGYAYSAPAATQPAEPPRILPAILVATGDVARVLAAAGVPPNEDMPMYWWRTEHRADLEAMCRRLNITVDIFIKRIEMSGRKAPGLRHIGDLEELVRG